MQCPLLLHWGELGEAAVAVPMLTMVAGAYRGVITSLTFLLLLRSSTLMLRVIVRQSRDGWSECWRHEKHNGELSVVVIIHE
jgi:hypothetical protein